MAQQIRNADMVELFETDFVDRNELVYAWKGAVSSILALSGLRGAWPMSAFDANGDATDLSDQNRHLTYNGSPIYGYDGIAPYIEYDGSADYLSRPDESGLDILGTETYVDSSYRGWTAGLWVYLDTLGDYETHLAKFGAAGTRSYTVRQGVAANLEAQVVVSVDGTAQTIVNSAAGTLTTGVWHFEVGRFIPSTELAVYLDGVFYRNTTSIPASIFNSAAAFTIGSGSGGSSPCDGKISLAWLCTTALSDQHIIALYESQRALFGV